MNPSVTGPERGYFVPIAASCAEFRAAMAGCGTECGTQIAGRIGGFPLPPGTTFRLWRFSRHRVRVTEVPPAGTVQQTE